MHLLSYAPPLPIAIGACATLVVTENLMHISVTRADVLTVATSYSRTLGSGLQFLMLYVAWNEWTRARILVLRLLSHFPSTLGLDSLGSLGISFPDARALFSVPCLGIVLWLI
ncbi:hypothetical protein NMY22_g4450 [Coprinellus aureogranulatus]|nr:hypothetical protein NMY22_g4450 [Coprinellus aureogranulatus]